MFVPLPKPSSTDVVFVQAHVHNLSPGGRAPVVGFTDDYPRLARLTLTPSDSFDGGPDPIALIAVTVNV